MQFGYGSDYIKLSNTHAHLGLHFQADGTWTNHELNIHKKACKGLNIFRLLKHALDRHFFL